MDSQQGIQLSDLSGILRRRGKLMVAVAGLVALTAFWMAMALPNQYGSYATILVEPQSIDERLVQAGVRESDLTERLGIMTAQILSRQRLSRMIDQFGLYSAYADDLQRQEVVDMMRLDVSVEPVISELEADKRNAREVEFNTFKINFRAGEPTVAAEVAQSIANDFLEKNIEARVEQSQQSLDFMDSSIASLTRDLTAIESEIKQVKAENTGSLPEEYLGNQRTLQTLSAQAREARRALDLATSDQAFWKNQVIAAVSMLSPNDPNSPAARKKMIKSEVGRMRSQGYTDKHPDVASALQEMDMLEERIDGDGEGDDEELPESYAEQNAKAEENRAALRIKAVQEEIGRLQEQITDLETRLAETPAVEERLDGLSRRYEYLSEAYRDYNQRRQQAVVQADLERKQLGEQFRILESAFPAPRPTSPNRVMILFVGLLMGGAFGAGAGLVAEAMDTSIHQPKDLQRLVQFPVLAAVPAIMLEPDRVARAKRNRIQAIVAIGVSLFFLAGGVLSYFLVNGPTESEDSERIEGVPEEVTVSQSFLTPLALFEEKRS
ncbi:MAG: Wzz/FepE/Etk N-terminal domain-containing protein [Myxococcota bacterium]|nr:Wzz/FepE/Etk N-terminal domain-containing protein [Myxococcota bacterium]